MTNNQRIEKIAKSLNVTRQRVYQLLRQAYLNGKIKKDSGGQYVIDDDAVKVIKSDYKKKSRLAYNSKSSKLKRLNGEIKELEEHIRQLELENAKLKQANSDSSKIIKALESNQQNLKDFKDTLNWVTKTAYMNKLPQLKENQQTTTPETKKHWWEKLF